MKIYHYHPITAEFLSEGLADKDPLVVGNWLIPAHATTTEPSSKTRKGHAQIFKDCEWLYIKDLRGQKVYNTETKEESIINYLGDIAVGFTLDKPEQFDEWDGDKWVKDEAKEKEFLISQAESQKSQLLSLATKRIEPLQDAVDLDVATDDELAQLKEWKKFRVLVNRVDTSLAPDIEWPEQPQ